MNENSHYKQVRTWLKLRGFTDKHCDYLIDKDKKVVKRNNRIRDGLIKDHTQVITVGNRSNTVTLSIIRETELTELIDAIEASNYNVLDEFISLSKKVQQEMEISSIALLVEPFREIFEEDGTSIRYDLATSIVERKIKPVLFPWHNPNCHILVGDEPFFSGFDIKEQIMAYAQIANEYKGCAVININDLNNISWIEKEWANICKSYLEQCTDTKKVKSRNIKPSTLALYKKWYERLLAIKQECENKDEYFSENNAHEQIAGEEKKDTSTIDKGIRAYLATVECSEISENS
ncbi:hypothetical protein [Thiothrix unzii]|uniref:Uncharacterized protein n=1 Tax=Thiothrix unzii TaxID=111769 RepID=A0A975F744_9GAMM|nr:hypothetical protein [Thiothrix unzii]QTR52675.1 hypothetical protein J9260_13310 [Thiothrix unzii]